MAKKEERRTIVISIAVFVLILYLSLRFFLDAYKVSMNKLGADFELAKLREEAWMLESRLVGADKIIALDADLPKLIDKIQELARKNMVKLDAIEPQGVQRDGLYGRMTLKLVAECDYNSLGNFISGLEGSKEFIRIDKLDIAPISAAEGAAKGAPIKSKAELFVSTIYFD